MMNYFKNKHTPLMNIKLLLVTAVLVVFSVNSSHADDIEIYTGLSEAEEVESKDKPNILFLLDTSGSMRIPEPIYAPRPDYDPSLNYSTMPAVEGTNPDSNVYVYADNLSYTGMFVSSDDNKCQAATTYFDEKPTFPQFRDKALVWQHNEAVESPEICTPDDSESVSESDFAWWWIGLDTISVTPGDTINVTVDTNRDGKFVYDFLDAAGDRLWVDNCWVENMAKGVNSCGSATVPANADRLIPFFDRDESPRDGSSITVTVSYPGTGECVGGDSTPENGDWQVKVDADKTDTIKALECAADNGVHGLTDNGELYPQYAEDSHSQHDQPNYVSAAGNASAVAWESTNIPQRYLIPENYHDYLQASSEDLLGLNAATMADAGNETTQEYCQDYTGGWDYRYDFYDRNYYRADDQDGDDSDSYFKKDGRIYQCMRRITILKKATSNLLETMSGMNVGIMRFNEGEGGSLVSTIRDIDDTTTPFYEIDESGTNTTTQVTARQDLINDLMALPARGSTPLQESLYQAYLYFSGSTVENGEASKYVSYPQNTTDSFPDSYQVDEDMNDPLAVESNSYISPIKNYCQDNNIILFSDGESTDDTGYGGAKGSIATFSGKTCGNGNGDCLDELAFGLANKKVNPSLPELNNVYTHTIAFGEAANSADEGTSQLNKASNAGLRPGADQESQSHVATDLDSLTATFQKIITNIDAVDSDSFVAPAVSVNAFNRISNNDELYYAVFEPNNTPRWDGNVKKYRLSPDGIIKDANDDDAIDSSTGFFTDSARSYWSTEDDGAVVTKGGFAKQLDFTTTPRKLYGITGSDDTPDVLTEVNFLDKVHRITRDGNGDIDTDGPDILLGAISKPDVDTNKLKIVKWSLGQDVEMDLAGEATDPNYFVGESLHSTPSIVSFGTNVEDPKSVIFAATNQGMLHAIDADDGKELWSYIPDPDLFKNLGAYFNRTVGADHVYGLDGEMTVDIVRDPVSKAVTKANLFMGQRRGGSKYFAIDVLGTSPKSSAFGSETGAADVEDKGNVLPQVQRLWTISPSTEYENASGVKTQPFSRLGQTWAKPVPLVVKHCTSNVATTCSYKKALVLAGGYDEMKYDGDNLVSSVTTASPAKGNDIYIVERDTGNLLWKASSSSFPDGNGGEMIHSFPSSPTVVDSDFDGVADLLFASDISGQIWRFDFKGYMEINDKNEIIALDDSDIITGGGNEANGKPSVIGGIIADLAEGEGDNTSRRFYNRLSVSLTPTIKDDDNKVVDLSRYNIALGSGYRAHPLSQERYPDASATATDNHIYMVYDRNLQFPKPKVDGDGKLTGDVTYSYDGGSVVDSADIPELTGTIDATPSGGVNYHGFHLDLTDEFEKVLNPSLTENFQVVTVTYTPGNSSSLSNSDACNKSVGRSRVYVTDLLTGETLSRVLQKPGLSAEPVVIVVPPETEGDPSQKVLCIATECEGASADETTSDGSGNLDKIGLGKSKNGQLIKTSWWEEVR